MDDNWKCVYTIGKLYRAELIKGMLQEEGIESMIMDQGNSGLPTDDVRVFVKNDDFDKAKTLIKDQEESE